ncbi:hypothetical protein GPECTOR_4g654 [Gonium pectorale]|uniref:Phosphatidylinositol-3,4,5-trisphosphate 3-phosphatase n=1 Tax=Gonium pectorale TaxID=33097 RepID=A0A150GXN8_GONPE|nr:hypothetical protein GPECTOR_4g654 [Gonium pectorale]|eukprot:KXZ54589.1 hypothetical protein GPECTOR_4g654 [Gonium pectorale]
MAFIARRLYRNPVHQVIRLLEERHGGRYKVYNLCVERGYDHAIFGGRVVRLPMYDGQAPPLDQLVALCRDAAAWLSADPSHVVAVHCKAGKGRTGVAVCALLLALEPRLTPDSLGSVLEFWAERRTKDRKGVTIASQRRFVEYFHAMMLASAGMGLSGPGPRPDTADQTGAATSAQAAVAAAATAGDPAGAAATAAAAAAAAGTSVEASLVVLDRLTVPVRPARLTRLVFRGLPPALLYDCTVSMWCRPVGHYQAHAVCHVTSGPPRGAMMPVSAANPSGTASAAASEEALAAGPLLSGDIKVQLFQGAVPEPAADVFKGGSSQFSAWLNTAFLDPRVGPGRLLLGRPQLDKLSKPLRRWRGDVALCIEYEVAT